jgi:biopolymer transport protein ExbD
MHLVGKEKRRIVDEINITPLTDVFLVLLIIMMVVAPMLKLTRPDIKPPFVDGGTPINKIKLVVEITKDGAYFVDGTLTDPSILGKSLKERKGHLAENGFIIQADRYVKSSFVLKVFDAAREAEFEAMTVAVETMTPARNDELEKKTKEQGAPVSS